MRDPMHTSVCAVCYQGTWYSPERITLPTERGRPPFVTDPGRWEYGNRAHEHGKPGAMNLRPIDRSSLARQFAPYYETGQRIRVEFVGRDGEVYETLTGTVGKTTGWRPVYLLMRRADSTGSVYTLGEADRVVAVKRDNGKYVSVRAY